jgi:hypothetical protein
MFQNLRSLNIPRIGSPIFGALFPAFVFVVAFLAAYLLYKHFSSRQE